MSEKPPNPGSDEAREQGCTCPVMDNGHGRGFPRIDEDGEPVTMFVMNEECTLHGTEARTKWKG